MRTQHLFGLTLACISLFRMSSVDAQTPRSTRDLEALSAKDANRVARQDLLSVFEPHKTFNSGMFRRLRGASFKTHVYGTEYKGVCAYDMITLWYAPSNTGGKPEDDPLVPYHVTTAPLFHFSHWPDATVKQDDPVEYVWDTACDNLGGEDTSWLSADNVFSAVQGLLVFRQAITQIKVGTLKSAPCPSLDNKNKTSCEHFILSLDDIDKIGSISSCAAAAGLLCYELDINNGTVVTIAAKKNGQEIISGSIISISVEEFITVT